MPPRKPRQQAALRDKLADDIRAFHLHIGERYAALGDSSYLEEGQARLRTLAAGEPLRIESWKLAAALWDLGDPAASRAVENSGEVLYVVQPGGDYRPV